MSEQFTARSAVEAWCRDAALTVGHGIVAVTLVSEPWLVLGHAG